MAATAVRTRARGLATPSDIAPLLLGAEVELAPEPAAEVVAEESVVVVDAVSVAVSVDERVAEVTVPFPPVGAAVELALAAMEAVALEMIDETIDEALAVAAAPCDEIDDEAEAEPEPPATANWPE